MRHHQFSCPADSYIRHGIPFSQKYDFLQIQLPECIEGAIIVSNSLELFKQKVFMVREENVENQFLLGFSVYEAKCVLELGMSVLGLIQPFVIILSHFPLFFLQLGIFVLHRVVRINASFNEYSRRVILLIKGKTLCGWNCHRKEELYIILIILMTIPKTLDIDRK